MNTFRKCFITCNSLPCIVITADLTEYFLKSRIKNHLFNQAHMQLNLSAVPQRL